MLKTKDLYADQGIHFAKIGSFATETNYTGDLELPPEYWAAHKIPEPDKAERREFHQKLGIRLDNPAKPGPADR